MVNLGLRTTHLKKIMGKIKILSTHNLFRRKFPLSVEKLQLPAPLVFF